VVILVFTEIVDGYGDTVTVLTALSVALGPSSPIISFANTIQLKTHK
jgi:hypothetical protein